MVGLIWILLGLAKASDPEPITQFLTRMGGSSDAARVLAPLVMGVEVGLGLLMLAALAYSRLCGPALLVSLLLSGAFGLITLTLGPDARCGCLGAFGKEVYGRKLLLAGALMFCSARLLLGRAPGHPTASEN